MIAKERHCPSDGINPVGHCTRQFSLMMITFGAAVPSIGNAYVEPDLVLVLVLKLRQLTSQSVSVQSDRSYGYIAACWSRRLQVAIIRQQGHGRSVRMDRYCGLTDRSSLDFVTRLVYEFYWGSP